MLINTALLIPTLLQMTIAGHVLKKECVHLLRRGLLADKAIHQSDNSSWWLSLFIETSTQSCPYWAWQWIDWEKRKEWNTITLLTSSVDTWAACIQLINRSSSNYTLTNKSFQRDNWSIPTACPPVSHALSLSLSLSHTHTHTTLSTGTLTAHQKANISTKQ